MLPLEDVDAEAIDGYIQQRKTDGVVNATINRDVAVLRQMLKLAMRKWRWLRQEPYIELLPEGGPRDRELSEAEAALYTGMRMGELLELMWGQVDLVNRTLDFPPTKRGCKRLLPIAEPLYYVLARLRASGGHAKTDRVFLPTDGRPWNKWAVEHRFGKAVEAAAIPPIRFHDRRHTIASRLKRWHPRDGDSAVTRTQDARHDRPIRQSRGGAVPRGAGGFAEHNGCTRVSAEHRYDARA